MRPNRRGLILDTLRYYQGIAGFEQVYNYIKRELLVNFKLSDDKYKKTVKSYLKILKKEGKITREGQGIYRIAPGLMSDGR